MTHSASFERFAPLEVGPETRVFVLTGAGISAESGVRTFRDSGGLWETYRFEEVASPEGWRRHPDAVWRFYAQRRQQALGCAPNTAHVALAALERRIGDRLFLCTQNVDDLHEKAGSTRVTHMHGELMKSRCETCDRPPFEDRAVHREIPRCTCGARLRPHIVWFGEVPFEMQTIAGALDACDLFVTVGSSGAVYPAAGFVAAVASRGRRVRTSDGAARSTAPRTIYVGPEEPDNADMFDECRLGRATEVLAGLFRE